MVIFNSHVKLPEGNDFQYEPWFAGNNINLSNLAGNDELTSGIYVFLFLRKLM